MTNLNHGNQEVSKCEHKNVKRDSGYLVCQDCGIVLEDNIDFVDTIPIDDHYKESQLDYERNIRVRDSKAKQDPLIKQQYDRIQTLEKWYRDYQTSFTEQRKTIEFLKSYGINIDTAKYEAIKKRYLKYNRNHRKSYQNMVIIFLAVIWMEIKDTTNIRIERFIEISNELGHKINKKMLNNAMLKVKKSEKMWKKFKTTNDIEKEIKNRIKILFGKDLHNIPYEKVKLHIPSKGEYNKLQVEMQLITDGLLNEISYNHLKNLNYKAFTAGLIYYVGQCLENNKIFTQSLIEEATKFSSTTIRKKFHILKEILGPPKQQD
ncbi:MAG: TFIIB-type zinc ribbon-containing protein [Promethearchaeota archaeon]